jgi:uncharacterized damage-inducible protein DinB
MNYEVMMKRTGMIFAVAGLMVTGVVMGQAPAGPTGPGAEALRSYTALKGNILKAAEKMPATDYAFKPTPEVRSFARVVNHVTEAQFAFCGAVNHVAADALQKPPAETADKDAILEALKASFAECDKAYGSATDANLLETFDLFKSKRSRIGALWGNVAHDDEQYATLALYLRLKGLVPPSSEK